MAKQTSIARGVILREYHSGNKAIVLDFSYRGVRCIETLSRLHPANKKANQKYAVRLLAEINNAIARQAFDYSDYFPDSNKCVLFGCAASCITLAQAQEAIIDDLEHSGQREATTINTYRKAARRVNSGVGGDIRITDLKPEHFRAWVRARGVCRRTINNDLIPARRALSRALNDGLINFNPLDRVEIADLTPAVRRQSGPDPFTLAEIDAILKTAHKYSDKAVNTIQASIYTGLRPQELVALTWDDIDLETGKLSVSRATMLSLRTADTKVTKTISGERVIDLLPLALEAFKRQASITRWGGGVIFPQWGCKKPVNRYKQIRKRWTTILKSSGVRYRPFKQCRHSFASHMLSSGETRIYLAHLLGHKSTSMLDVYSKFVDDWIGDYCGKRFGYDTPRPLVEVVTL